jgi:hypothetical protein
MPSFSRRFETPLLILILLAAVFFRFHKLDSVPPGLTHDEGAVGFFVRQVADGTGFSIDAPYGYANEPFTQYSAAVVMILLGQSDWALRTHQAFWGVVLVLGTFVWGRAAFGRAVGLSAAALAAVNFWPVMTSRFALNSSPAPALITLAFWLMWIALFKEHLHARSLAWLGFALALAGALVTYEASRGAWLALPAFLVYLLIVGPRQRLGQFAAALTFGTALALPHLLNPAAWGRTGTLAEPLTAAASGNFRPLLDNAVEAFGTLFLKGDPFIVYNIPGRPVFDPLLGALFVGGLLICLWRWRGPAYCFALLWFGAGFAPAAAIGAFTMMLHAITAQTIVLTLPALIAQYFGKGRFGRLAWGGFALLIGFTALATFDDYFNRWADAPETRAAYFSNFAAVSSYLHSTSFSGPVTLSSPFPGLPHDPFTADLRVRRDDLDLRWFDAREALVFPQTNESLLVLPSNAQPDPLFAARLPVLNAKRQFIRQSDVDPYFDLVLWQPQKTLADWLNDGSLTVAASPADFDGAAALIAFSVDPVTAHPGDVVTAITFWRVLDPAALGPVSPINYAREANIFLHLLDPGGNFAAGNDRLNAPAWNWHTGDTFAQIHRLSLPPDLAPGHYTLQVGLYTLPDLARLPRRDVEGADTAVIGEIQIRP